MKNHHIKSILDKIEKEKTHLNCEMQGAIFRGQRIGSQIELGKEGWSLKPQLIREKHRARGKPKDIEKNLYECFISNGGSQIDRGKSSWEVLAEMQHHGVYTRLLDWTESLATALYFAVQYQPWKDRNFPCIWIANAYTLTQHALENCSTKAALGIPGSGVTPRVVNFCVPEYPKFDYAETIFNPNISWPFDHPFVMEAPYTNVRLRSQKGLFSVHGNKPEGVERSMNKFVRPITLTPDEEKAAKAFIKDLGINHYTYFPDLDGLAMALNEVYFK